MASFCAVLFPLDVLDDIWDLIVSVSEGFPTYSFNHVWAWRPSNGPGGCI